MSFLLLQMLLHFGGAGCENIDDFYPHASVEFFLLHNVESCLSD